MYVYIKGLERDDKVMKINSPKKPFHNVINTKHRVGIKEWQFYAYFLDWLKIRVLFVLYLLIL